jgi:hypothetical protein
MSLSKKAIVIALTLLLPIVMNAQQFNGGVLGGMTISKPTGNPKAGGWKKVGAILGGYVNLDFSRHSALQVELEYIMKGGIDNPDVSKGKTDSYLLRLGYIEMPVLYQFKFLERFSLETGPSVNFLLHSYERINGADNVIEPPYTDVGFSWNIGASFYITDRIWFTFRANNSLINTRTRTVTDMVWRFWAYGEYNDVFILALYYRLNKLGKDRKSP